MSMVRERLFEASFSVLGKASVNRYYREFTKMQWWPLERRMELQIRALARLLAVAYQSVPYYRDVFDTLGLRPEDIRSLQDLQNLPVLTKETIRQQKQRITSEGLGKLRYVHGHTGGSTGEPLKYLMSDEDQARGIALLHRGWGYGGYRRGEPLAILAGYSLVPTTRSALRKQALTLARNVRHYPSYVMDDRTLKAYVRSLNEFRPRFLRGYPSSIFTVARFIMEYDLPVNFDLKAVFTTGETLLEGQRRIIEEVFHAQIFDNYGLNDGGVSAYECKEHHGMHVDLERAILEVVDDSGKQVVGKPGRILATSLYNYALPFIRYETGDIGTVVQSRCGCGRESMMLTSLEGRTTDLLTLAGKAIRFPATLFADLDVRQYQVIQEREEGIIFRIVKGEMYGRNDEALIRQWVRQRIGKVDVMFDYVDSIASEDGRKHRVIIDCREKPTLY